MRVAALILGLAALVASPAPAQQDALAERLDEATYRAVQALLTEARRDSLPVAALEGKALEGAAKQVPSARIVAALRQLVGELRTARQVLRQARPDGALLDGEVMAAAEAMRRGTPREEIAAVRTAAPAGVGLEIAMAVLGELVQRGVPADQARAVIVHLVETGVSQARMVEIPSRVDVALRVGAHPVAALGSALQGLGIPGPPFEPGSRRPRRPDIP